MHAVGILISGFFQPAFSIYKLKGLDVYQICVTDILDQNYESIPRKLQWFVKVFLPSVFIWTHTFFSFGLNHNISPWLFSESNVKKTGNF